MALHEVDRAHHHARRAEAALQAVAFLERRLHRMQRAVGRGEAFDRHDRRAVAPARRGSLHALTALPSRCTVHAPHWPVSQPTCVPVSAEVVAQEIDEQRARVDVGGDRLAVDGQGKRDGHVAPPSGGAASANDTSGGGRSHHNPPARRLQWTPGARMRSGAHVGPPRAAARRQFRLAMYCDRFSMSSSDSVPATLVMLPASLVRRLRLEILRAAS